MIAEVQFTKTLIGAESPAPVGFNCARPGYKGFKERSYPGEVDLEIITVRVEPLDSSLPDAARWHDDHCRARSVGAATDVYDRAYSSRRFNG